jgi:hypothetical protein
MIGTLFDASAAQRQKRPATAQRQRDPVVTHRIAAGESPAPTPEKRAKPSHNDGGRVGSTWPSYIAQARFLPCSWPLVGGPPPEAAMCSACHYRKWDRTESGYVCRVCHPAPGAALAAPKAEPAPNTAPGAA